ncbi:MAG: hypothetical protein GC164_04630 [Phycisphaera sp.]|nr:hypothetical protein [Phycisphaera sp.]
MYSSRLAVVCAFFSIALFTGGCDERSEIRTYNAPKEVSPMTMGRAPAMAVSDGQGAGEAVSTDRLEWALPAGWSQRPGGGPMREMTLTRSSDGFEITVTKLPLQSGSLLANVNRWRKQMGLAETDEAALPGMTRPLEGGQVAVTLVDLATQAAVTDAASHERMLAALIHTTDSTWFFKARGSVGLIAGVEPDFLLILRSVHPAQVTPNPHVDHARVQSPVNGDGVQNIGPVSFRVPEGWSLDPQPRNMRFATLVFTHDNRSGEMAITAFPGDVGGELANVNRWRNQVGLLPVASLDSEDAGTVNIDGQEARVYRFVATQGPSAGMGIVVAPIQHDGQTWFFKMTGAAPLLESQYEPFVSFLESLRFQSQ